VYIFGISSIPGFVAWQSIYVGLITIVTMLFADRLFRMIPAVIIALCVEVEEDHQTYTINRNTPTHNA